MRRSWRSMLFGAAAAMLFPQAAHAEWYEARTRQFVVYANDKEERVREMAERLDRFASLIRTYHAVPQPEGADQNPVTIYVTPSIAEIQRMAGPGVAGFYVGRASGPVAYTPKRSNSEDLKPQIVLFHEYAHHFLLGNYAQAYPAWFSEGYAEFFSTARIDAKIAMLGYAANHRGYGLFATNGLSLAEMFAPPDRRLTDIERETIYARGWLLTHYLLSDPARRLKLSAYLRAFNAGKPSLQAARDAFGDIAALNRALDQYLRGRLKGVGRTVESLPSPQTEMRLLAPGEAAMLPLRMVSDHGVDAKTAKSLHLRGRPIAAAHPADAVVQGWFAELAFDAGELEEADAAATRAITIDPKSMQGLLYKARIGLARAAEAKADAVAWTQARSWILKANKVSTDDAGALAMFYASYQAQGIAPSKSAIAGLYRAFELVPQDDSLRWSVVRQYLRDGDSASAATVLRPLAYSPHGGEVMKAAAAKTLEQIAAGMPAVQVLAALDAAGQAAKGGSR